MKSNNKNNRHKNQLELNVVLLNSEHLTFTIFNCTVNSYLKTTLTSWVLAAMFTHEGRKIHRLELFLIVNTRDRVGQIRCPQTGLNLDIKSWEVGTANRNFLYACKSNPSLLLSKKKNIIYRDFCDWEQATWSEKVEKM